MIFMPLTLYTRRLMPWPTLLGWLALSLLLIGPILLWGFRGEAFLATTDNPASSDVLIVEGWIGYTGIEAAKAEFEKGHYQRIVTVGGPTNNRWGRQRWNYALLASDELKRLGVPAEKIISAPTEDLLNHRTFASAVAVTEALERADIRKFSATIFTLGAHARRSRLVFAKTLPSGTQVGVISWQPFPYEAQPWWQSSERATDFVKESAGWAFELFLNSGRSFGTRRE